MVGFWRGLSFWPVGGCLLVVFSHAKEHALVSLPLLIKGTSSMRSGLHLYDFIQFQSPPKRSYLPHSHRRISTSICLKGHNSANSSEFGKSLLKKIVFKGISGSIQQSDQGITWGRLIQGRIKYKSKNPEWGSMLGGQLQQMKGRIARNKVRGNRKV